MIAAVTGAGNMKIIAPNAVMKKGTANVITMMKELMKLPALILTGFHAGKIKKRRKKSPP